MKIKVNPVPDCMKKTEYEKTLWRCEALGIPCEFGICDECSNTSNTNNGSDKDGRERENDNCQW